jgi:isopenicillin N synthase-like dioxygenase
MANWAALDRSSDANVRTAASVKRKAVTELPVIDVTAFTEGGSLAERKAVARQIHDACVNIGFFYITGHGFSREELDRSIEYAHRFFALPLEQKMTVWARDHAAKMGYIPHGGLDPDANADKKVDLKERFYIARDLMPGEAVGEAHPAGMSHWPKPDILPGFEEWMRAQGHRQFLLGKQLSRAFSLSLDLPEDYLENFHDRMGVYHSLNYYPKQEKAAEQDLDWGFSPHTDYGSFSILLQDRTGGLQAHNADGDWIEVPPIPGTFTINVGDLLERWTNDYYVSTLHRVLNTNPAARASITYFVYANPRARVDCLETCVSPERPQRYEPIIAGDYIKELVTQAYLTGRSGVSDRTAERLSARA